MTFSADKEARVFVAGHRGLVGSAILRNLQERGHKNLLLRTHGELDLANQAAVNRFFDAEKPQYVILAAAKVGGIKANYDERATFLAENLSIQTNVIMAAEKTRVKKLLFLGSSCIYPKFAPQPIKEESLLTGALEMSNEAYAIAKIAGLKLCQYLNEMGRMRAISAMPTNMYGPGDNYHPDKSHVIPGMLGKFHKAKKEGLPWLELWGTGSPLREFLYSDDCAEALLTLMDRYDEPQTINVGSGQELSIKELAQLIADTVGFTGEVRFNPQYPDGTPRKLLSSERINTLGWKACVSLKEGLRRAYQWALDNNALD